MKNLEKQFKEGLKLMRANSNLVVDREYGLRYEPRLNYWHSALMYRLGEKMYIEAQEEVGRQNKTAILKKMRAQGITKGSFKERHEQYKKLFYANKLK